MITCVTVAECDKCKKHVELERELSPDGYVYSIPYNWYQEKLEGKAVHLCPQCYLRYDFLATFLRPKKKG